MKSFLPAAIVIASFLSGPAAAATHAAEGTPAVYVMAEAQPLIVSALPATRRAVPLHLDGPRLRINRPEPKREALEFLPDGPLLTNVVVGDLPIAGMLYRRAGARFNTSDGSSADAFAICYRFTPRVGLQVIPGDPAPNKLPVSTLANNTGVTVGMTLRLGH